MFRSTSLFKIKNKKQKIDSRFLRYVYKLDKISYDNVQEIIQDDTPDDFFY